MLFLTIFGILFAFLMTVTGSSLVFLFKKPIGDKLNTFFYGISAGVMFGATIFSLIIPSMNASESYGALKFVPTVIGIVFGAFFIVFLDFFVQKTKKNSCGLNRNMKIFLAVTIHNIPEGLAIGFAFGVALNSADFALCYSALSLAIGIGIQNFPEGSAISLPLKKELGSGSKAFLFGLYSALVEPIASVLGIFLAYSLSCVYGYILAFSAGAMIYVIIEEILPEANLKGYEKIRTWSFILGFLLMMILDTSLV